MGLLSGQKISIMKRRDNSIVGIKEDQRLGVSLDDEAADCKASVTYEETNTQLYLDPAPKPCWGCG